MNKSIYIYLFFVFALGMTLVECLAALKGEEVSGGTHVLWGFVSLLLTALWANEDSKTSEFEKPFEFGFLIYMLWPILFPWYLYKTRKAEGLMMFIGVLSLFYGPWLAGLVVYVYFT